MNWIQQLFSRRRLYGDLSAEIQEHLAEKIDELVEGGMSREEAAHAARREFGNVTLVEERSREVWQWPSLENFFMDVRYGARMLRKNSGFTAVAVFSLALGIGANTAIFSYVNALLLRPPPGVSAPAGLLAVWNHLPSGGYMQYSYPDYVYYRDHNTVFSGLAAYNSDLERVAWSAGGETKLIVGQLVSGNFFSVLGVKPTLGRAFLPEEDQVALRNPVVVLNYAFWQQRLGSDLGVIGKTLTLNGNSFSVVGVTPADFSGIETGFVPDFWSPMMMQRQIFPAMDLLANRTGYWLFVAGRRKPGVTPKQAQADLSVLEKQLEQAFPKSNKGWDAAVMPMVGIPPELREFAVPFTALLMAVVGMVLLIACANAANLLLAKASRRSREMAVRSALGASRGRIIRQILTESALLSLAAGVVGTGLSVSAGPLLLKLKPPMLSFIDIQLPLDWRVLAFTLLVSLLAGFVFGVAPALRSSKVDVVSRLKDETAGSHARSRLRNVLVTGQVAVCTVLLIGAGLCLRSLMRAASVDPGFQVNNRLNVTLDLDILGYSESRGRGFYDRLVESVKALPGVRSASVANHLPLGFSSMATAVAIDGFEPPPGQPGIIVGFTGVGPGYFQTMGTPLLRGREFSRQDNNTSRGVAIINEAMAQRYWPGQDPIGRRIALAFGKRQSLEIVGVAATGKYRNLREESQPFMFRPFSQVYEPQGVLVVQTAGDPKPMLATVEREIHALDANLPVLDAETMAQYMSIPLFVARITGTLLGVFGLLALVLAAVGLSGVVAYFVSLRTREIGVRLALGAERRDVLKLVVKQGMRLSLVGVIIGLAAALGVSRALSSLLYGIRPTDPVTYISVAFVLTAVTLLASYLPARRATKVDPMVALRYE
ncbi:MAG TPA: ABC transporter permease [Terriglobia bacterium]|nr:ABC transporter permease [Terriglobia bacterium]